MGLAAKLGKTNTQTDNILSTANMPINSNGFNVNNVSALNYIQPEPITQETYNEIINADLKAQSDYDKKENNQYNLIKPNVPINHDPQKQIINNLITNKMWRIVCLKQLYAFYNQNQLQMLINRACSHDYQRLQIVLNLPTIDMTTDLAVLGLYDIVLLLDDSGSMSYVDSGEEISRFQILKEVVKTISFGSTLMDPDGIVIRFLNSSIEGNGLKNVHDVNNIFAHVSPKSSTPIGSALINKIFNNIVKNLLISNDLTRPILTIIVTDGCPDDRNEVIQVIKTCKTACERSKYGQNAMAFSFAQIGKDKSATEYLSELDCHFEIGHLIDCTSEYDIERAECGSNFTESAWIIKLMIGAVDPDYDQADEQFTNNNFISSQYVQPTQIHNYYGHIPIAQAIPLTTSSSSTQYNTAFATPTTTSTPTSTPTPTSIFANNFNQDLLEFNQYNSNQR